MINQYNKIKAVTAGEHLFIFLAGISGKLLREKRISNISYMNMSGREECFGEYLEGALLSFSFKRLMKLAHSIFSNKNVDPARANQDLNRLVKSWFYWLEVDEVNKLTRLCMRAQIASYQKIPKDTREELFYSRSIHFCCFCGCRLSADANGVHYDPSGKLATLEHIWPQSLGGDSESNNLVPACGKCNETKSDIFVWQQALVHDFIHPFNFSADEDSYLKFPRHKKIILQRRAVMMVAQRDGLSLKAAMKKVGPFGDLKALDLNDTWDFFNVENHSDSMGEVLW